VKTAIPASAARAAAGPNAKCPCGSGRKYKHCCGGRGPTEQTARAAECYARGNDHLGRGQLDEAIRQFRGAIAAQPGFFQAHSNLGLALESRGLRAEALDSYWAAARLATGTAEAHGTSVNYLVCLNAYQRELFEMLRSDAHTPLQVLDRHLALACRLAAHANPSRREHDNTRERERRLRVAYLSPDFRTHSVAYFMAPVIAAHDRTRVEVFCYYTCPLSDGITNKIAQLADHWLACADLSDDELAARLRADGIDILVDLAGHTIGNRILTLARKPAPIQISYLGYPHVTGLDAMDYLLTDEFAAPRVQPRAHEGERVLPLKSPMVVYQPAFGSRGLLAAAGPAVVPPPMLSRGYPTFGCFNDTSKISDAVIATWARLLAAVPGARLLLKSRALGEPAACAALLARFRKLDVDPDRLQLEGRIDDLAEHLARYGSVDVALDTFPYNGVTTTFEALWMGVPFVTLAGEVLCGRMGLSIATNANHPEWIADSAHSYVERAAALVRDPQVLARLRQHLRGELESSALLDAGNFTRHLEAAYRGVWATWCTRPDHRR